MTEETNKFVDLKDVLQKDQKIDWTDLGSDEDDKTPTWNTTTIDDTKLKSLSDIQQEQENDPKQGFPEQDTKGDNKSNTGKYVAPKRSTGTTTSGSSERRGNFPRNITIPTRGPYVAMVRNLAYSITDDDLKIFFEDIGYIKSARVVYNRDTQQSRGFGYVEFEGAEDLKSALERNERDFNGRKIEVSVKLDQRGDRGDRDQGGYSSYNKPKYSFNEPRQYNNDRTDRTDRNYDNRTKSSPPRERKPLVLQPKTASNDDGSGKTNQSIFGSGKVVPTEYQYDSDDKSQRTNPPPERVVNREVRDNSDNRSGERRFDTRDNRDNRSGDNRDNRDNRSGERRFDNRDNRDNRGGDRSRNNKVWENRGPEKKPPTKQVDNEGFAVRGGKRRTVTRTNPSNNPSSDNKDEDSTTFVSSNKFDLLANQNE
jgi:RNA recognition motif-containing protein